MVVPGKIFTLSGEDYGVELMGGKFGDWLKSAIKNVSAVTGSLTEVIEGKKAPALPPPPPSPLGGISPMLLIGGGVGIVALLLIMKKR
jgi:hypothetical protein